MSRWRNVNPANYAPKGDPLGEMAQGFADVFVPTYLKKKELEEKRAYEEEKARKARAAAAAKAAKEQEKKDAADAKAAKAIVARLAGMAGVDPSTVSESGYQTILNDVQTWGKAKAFDTYLDNNDGPLQVNPNAFFSASTPEVETTTPNTSVEQITAEEKPVDTAPVTTTQEAEASPVAVEEPVVTNNTLLADQDTQTDAALSEAAAPQADDLEATQEQPAASTSSAVQPMFQARLPDAMELRTEYSTPELAREAAKEFRSKATQDPRYATLADDMDSWANSLSVDNPTFDQLTKMNKVDLQALILAPNVSDDAKANAKLIVDGRKNDVPWTDITEENYQGFIQQYPEHAADIKIIAQSSAQGILSLEELNALSLGTLEGLYNTKLIKDMGLNAVVSNLINGKENELFATLAGKDNDELIGVTKDDVTYPLKARRIAQSIIDARNDQNFDIANFDNYTVEMLNTLQQDPTITPQNRVLIEDLAQRKAEDLQSFRSYAEKVTNVATAETQLALAQSEGASANVLNELQTLLENQRKAKLKSDLAQAGLDVSAVIDAVLEKADGTKDYILARRDSEGKLFPVEQNLQGTVRLMSELEADAFKTIRSEVQKYSMNLADQNANIAEALRNAEMAIGIAKKNPMVRNAGGGFAQFVTSAVRGTESIFTVAGSLLDNSQKKGKDAATGEDVTYITQEEVLQAMQAQGRDKSFLDAIVSQDVQNLADETAKFEATMIILAFRSGRIEGQSGNAMSNKDFERLMQMLETKGSVDAFESQLRGYMKSKIQSYDDKTETYLGTNSNLSTFFSEYGYYPTTKPMSFQEFVTRRGEGDLTNAYQNTMSVELEQATTDTVQAKGTMDDPIPVTSVDEAMKYPVGTVVQSPDGRKFKVPAKKSGE